MAVKGVFASDAGIQGDRIGDFASSLLQISPTGSAQLFAMTSGMRSEDATDTIVTWFEENHISGRIEAQANYNSGDTSIVVDDASSIPAGTIMMIEATGEYIFVANVVSNTLTVIRGFAGTAAQSIAVNGGIQRIGTATEEGSGKPEAIANLGYPRFNNLQIFRNTWSVTGTAQAVSYHTGSKVAKNRADCLNFHAEDIERSLIWGRKTIGTRNGQPYRTMDGVNAQIKTNKVGAGSTTSMKQLDDFFMAVFSRNIKGKPNERIGYCGNKAISVLNDIARIEGSLNINVGQTDFGLEVTTWRTPYGTVRFMTHPLMNESPVWTKEMYLYHPGAMMTRYLRRTHMDDYSKDGSRAGSDADYGVVTTELTAVYEAEITGGILTGLTKGAAVA